MPDIEAVKDVAGGGGGSKAGGPVHEPLPPAVEVALWRGDQLGSAVADVGPTGFPQLDAALPGGGWRRRSRQR